MNKEKNYNLENRTAKFAGKSIQQSTWTSDVQVDKNELTLRF